MTSLPCDIVLLPSRDLADKAIELSRELQSYGTLFTLDGHAYYPHVSLYMTQLKAEDMPKVQEELARIAAMLSPFELTVTRYDQAMGYLDAEYRRSETLDKLQVAVVAAINPLRDGMREKDRVRMMEADGLALDNFEQYGYKYTGDLFRPHLTITRFGDEKSIDDTTLPNPAHVSGKFDRLGLFEMGDNGTCIRELATFDLNA